MARQPVSLTIDEANLAWLRGLTARSGARSVSETVNRIIAAARESGTHARASARSVVGSIDLAPDDPGLDRADEAVREYVRQSLARDLTVHEASARYGARRKRG